MRGSEKRLLEWGWQLIGPKIKLNEMSTNAGGYPPPLEEPKTLKHPKVSERVSREGFGNPGPQ